MDLWGIGVLALGIGSLQVPLDTGQRKDWFSSQYIRTFAALRGFGLVALIIRELMTDHPVSICVCSRTDLSALECF